MEAQPIGNTPVIGKMTLRGKVYLLNTLLLCITVLGAVLMVWYTFKIETIFKEIVNRNVEIFQSAEALGTSLVNQKGFVSYYILDNNPDWIVQLNRYRERFNAHLASVATLVSEPWEQEKMLQISDKESVLNNLPILGDTAVDEQSISLLKWERYCVLIPKYHLYSSKFSRELNIENPGIQEEATTLLRRYPWPGNIRELSNMIHKVMIFNRGAPISNRDVAQIVNQNRHDLTPHDEILGSTGEIKNGGSTLNQWVRQHLLDPAEPYQFDDFMETISRIVISEALELTNGNRSQAAKLLGISRPTLHARIDKYHIECKAHVVSG